MPRPLSTGQKAFDEATAFFENTYMHLGALRTPLEIAIIIQVGFHPRDQGHFISTSPLIGVTMQRFGFFSPLNLLNTLTSPKLNSAISSIVPDQSRHSSSDCLALFTHRIVLTETVYKNAEKKAEQFLFFHFSLPRRNEPCVRMRTERVHAHRNASTAKYTYSML